MYRKPAFILVVLLLPINAAFAYYDLGKPTGFVDDYTNTLTLEQKDLLENKLAVFEKQTTNEVFVVVIQSLRGDSVENFANELFNNWGIGKKDKNNGVLFLISLDEHQTRIEVGYGLESLVTDAQAFQLIDKIAKPAFRNLDYYDGIDTVITNLFTLVNGGELNSNSEQGSFDIKSFVIDIVILLIILFLSKGSIWWFGGFGGGGRSGGGFGGGGGGRSGGGGASGSW